MSDWEFIDDDGEHFTVRSGPGIPGQVFVITTDSGVRLPVHKIPEACRALYETAGLPVPDLPDIPDPAQINELANAIIDAAKRPDHPSIINPNVPISRVAELARELLAAGYRKDGA